MESQQDVPTGLFSRELRFLLIGFLFITAFGIRLYRINEFPRNLHPGRPYHHIIIARGYYFENLKSIPASRRQVATINKEFRPAAEPRIVEHIAVLAYRIAGGEYLWIPRLLSSIFWLIGGGVLYLLVKKITSADAALFSLAFYLFLPYGVSASRSFMPHPLMVMMLMFSLLAIFRYYEQPSTPRFVIAAILSAIAMLIYPSALFPVFGAFLSLAFYKHGVWKAVISPKFLLFAIIALLPVAIHYSHILFSARYLGGHIQYSLSPGILLRSFFWRGWFGRIDNILGLPALIGALLGVFMARKGPPKALLIGLWLGYLVYVSIFNYHNATHSYYQIVFIPTVSLSLGPIGALVANRLSQTCTQWYWRVPVLAVILMAVFLQMYKVRQEMFNPNFEREIKIAKEIGRIVEYSTKTILLTEFHKSPFQYHGELSGQYWPRSGDFRARAMRGERIPTAEEQFKTLYLEHSPEYFIVTDFREYNAQRNLRNFLTQNFPVVVNNRNYLIFDLRKSLKER